LWPPDGLNLKSGVRGELFGYGYLPLPLTDPKAKTADNPIPMGNQSWTLFLNTENFKGPVAFFTPYFWSEVLADKPELAGKLLDASKVDPNRALQMETQYIPAEIATAKDGTQYAAVASVRYPKSENGETRVVHQIRSYKRSALWESVAAWFDGGEAADGLVDPASAVVHEFTGGGAATWKIYGSQTSKDDRSPIDWKAIATPAAIDQETFGYRWSDAVSGDPPLVELPRFFRLVESKNGTKRWQAIAQSEVPVETKLLDKRFPRYERLSAEAYETPGEADSCWKTPGPASGPFVAYPGDGSEVTYYWYRFADQPAILNAGLNDAERETLQRRVEKLHRTWTLDREYLPPPREGQLAELDHALIVTPPKGLEIGYVPIATRQASR
jgi:hypothetical protein